MDKKRQQWLGGVNYKEGQHCNNEDDHLWKNALRFGCFNVKIKAYLNFNLLNQAEVYSKYWAHTSPVLVACLLTFRPVALILILDYNQYIYCRSSPALNQSTVSEAIQNRLFQAKSTHRQPGRPFVTLSYAQSLDGSIALNAGSPLNISNKQAHTFTHQLRAAHQAILVGINTVLSDNPHLTVRLATGKNPQPVILDSQLRCPPDANLVQNSTKPLWIITANQVDENRQAELEKQDVIIFRVAQEENGKLNLNAALQHLAKQGIQSLMVEGGSQVITSFLKARLVDQMVLTVAPMFIGGLRSVEQLGITTPDKLPRLRNLHHQYLGDNLIVRGDPIWDNK